MGPAMPVVVALVYGATVSTSAPAPDPHPAAAAQHAHASTGTEALELIASGA